MSDGGIVLREGSRLGLTWTFKKILDMKWYAGKFGKLMAIFGSPPPFTGVGLI